MIKKKIVKTLLKSIMVIAILNLNSFSSAEDSCSVNNFGSGLPLILQDYNYSEDWFSTLYLNTSKETISRNAFMEAWVGSGEWGCPPYEWKVSGSGFHFIGMSGPTELNDKYEDEIIKLWADNTACGTATITVTDQCNQVATTHVISTTGQWKVVGGGTACGNPPKIMVYEYLGINLRWQLYYAVYPERAWCPNPIEKPICGIYYHQGSMIGYSCQQWTCQ